jgi:hypothetical protein
MSWNRLLRNDVNPLLRNENNGNIVPINAEEEYERQLKQAIKNSLIEQNGNEFDCSNQTSSEVVASFPIIKKKPKSEVTTNPFPWIKKKEKKSQEANEEVVSKVQKSQEDDEAVTSEEELKGVVESTTL